ncbi:retron Ec48 family effector membrane protein [Marinobacter salexigens]|uniref:retron Ec48 family effector membrane protein n=1 Tax=Marinobacter salexigens TaxID=1925763 RepID=UPI000C291318|nr:retron Ec48 family effector membrane protein [Marinobacter salexigens]
MKVFIGAILTIAFITFVFSVLSYWQTLSNSSLSFEDFCLASQCVLNFEKTFSGTIKIMQFGAAVAWIFVFVSGVYIALKNYLTSVRSTALSGHISHLSMFKEYLEGEVVKFGMLKLKEIDVYKWYGFAFPNSSKGDISVSKKYLYAVSEILSVIEETNLSIKSPKGGYGYRKHQDRVKRALAPFGIDMPYLPKNNFNDVEIQIFNLIDSVNHTFTDLSDVISDCDRDYV